jgi:hypothetical protein
VRGVGESFYDHSQCPRESASPGASNECLTMDDWKGLGLELLAGSVLYQQDFVLRNSSSMTIVILYTDPVSCYSVT